LKPLPSNKFLRREAGHARLHAAGGRGLIPSHAPPPGSVVRQRVLVARKVAKKFADVSLNTVDAGYVPHVLALRPTGEGRELAPTRCPATVPQAPRRTLQATNRLVGLFAPP
jgi:hypothetical protein